MKKSYDKGKIMKEAWSLYRNSTHTNPTFSECLKSAWELAKMRAMIDLEAQRYYSEVCLPVVALGEDAVDDARREWRRSDEFKALDYATRCGRDRAWKAAAANFRDVAFIYGVM